MLVTSDHEEVTEHTQGLAPGPDTLVVPDYSEDYGTGVGRGEATIMPSSDH